MTKIHANDSQSLRLDARLAFLDGRTKRARDLNKLADRQDRQERAAQRREVAQMQRQR